MVPRPGGACGRVRSPAADPHVAVLPTVLWFWPGVRARVLYCLPGVASVCSNLQRSRDRKPGRASVLGTDGSRDTGKSCGQKRRRPKRLGLATYGFAATVIKARPEGLEPPALGSEVGSRPRLNRNDRKHFGQACCGGRSQRCSTACRSLPLIASICTEVESYSVTCTRRPRMLYSTLFTNLFWLRPQAALE